MTIPCEGDRTREQAARNRLVGKSLDVATQGVKMSLTVNLYYTGHNGSARAFAQEMVTSGIVDRVRAQEGNERYEYFFPMNDPETVLLIDRWHDQEALDQHHHSEMMTQIAQLREKYALHLRVERYRDDH
jgi:quinol monooxygenase YgiN